MKKHGVLILALLVLGVGLVGCSLQPGSETSDDSSSTQTDSGTNRNNTSSHQSSDANQDQDQWTDYSNSEDKYKPLCIYDSDCLFGQVCGGGQCRDVSKKPTDPKKEQEEADKKKQEEAFDAQGPQMVGDAVYEETHVTIVFDREIVFDNILRDSLEISSGNVVFYAVAVKSGKDKKTAVFELNELPKDGVSYKFLVTGGQNNGPKDAKSKTYMIGDRKWFHTFTKEELGI